MFPTGQNEDHTNRKEFARKNLLYGKQILSFRNPLRREAKMKLAGLLSLGV